jgi:hypothetical protein
MTSAQTDETTPRRPLRLWPGVAAVVLLWVARFVLPDVVPETTFFGVLAGMLGGVVVLLWWLFFSRAPWSERLGALALMVLGLLATARLVHESIANGMMGMMLLHPGPEPRPRAGRGGRPALLHRRPARISCHGDPAWLRSVRAPSHRWN